MPTKEIPTDVLVVGGGPGAFFASIKAMEAGAERVTLVCKATAGNSGSAMYMGGYIRDYKPEEAEAISPRVVRDSAFLVDQDWLLESMKRVHENTNEMRKWGVKFINERGKEVRTGEGVSQGKRLNPVVWVDNGPPQFLWTLRSRALSVGVDIIDRVMVTDLLLSDGKHPTDGEVAGAVGFSVRNGDFYVFKANAIVLATGAWCTPRWRPPDITGDGQAMVIRAGAIMRSMECIQVVGGRGTLGNATVPQTSNLHRDFGTRLVNVLYPELEEEKDHRGTGLRLTERRGEFNLQPAREALKIERKDIPYAESYGGPVWDFGWRQSFRECTSRGFYLFLRNNPRVPKIYEKLGYEITEDLIPQVSIAFEPGPSSIIGGVRINRSHETNIPGLFVVGGASDNVGYRQLGLSGATIGGAIAGVSAAKYAEKKAESTPVRDQVENLRKIIYAPMGVKDGLRPVDLRHKLMEAVCGILGEKGVFTNEERLNRAIDAMEMLEKKDLPKVLAKDPHQLMKANELRNMFRVFPPSFRGLVLRKESRYLPREDYAYRDDKNYLKFLNFRLIKDGETEFWWENVPPLRIRPKAG